VRGDRDQELKATRCPRQSCAPQTIPKVEIQEVYTEKRDGQEPGKRKTEKKNRMKRGPCSLGVSKNSGRRAPFRGRCAGPLEGSK